jgi:hypothetical protein
MKSAMKAMTCVLLLMAGQASAATLGIAVRSDPQMTIAAGSLDTQAGGAVFAAGEIGAFTAGGVAQPVPLEFLIDVFDAGARDGVLSVYVPGSVSDVLTGSLRRVGFEPGRIELLFRADPGSDPSFGSRILVILTSPDLPADPFATDVTTDTLAGVIATPVPLPAALPMAAAAFAALGGVALRRRRTA